MDLPSYNNPWHLWLVPTAPAMLPALSSKVISLAHLAWMNTPDSLLRHYNSLPLRPDRLMFWWSFDQRTSFSIGRRLKSIHPLHLLASTLDIIRQWSTPFHLPTSMPGSPNSSS